MVNETAGSTTAQSGADETVRDAEFALALSYARAADRAALSALFALDTALGRILRTTSEPLVGQMRLTWWHDALRALDDGPAPAEPVLHALATHVLPRDVTGDELALLVEGWEVLLADPAPDAAALQQYATARGARLFALAGKIVGPCDGSQITSAGAGWALADLARHVREATTATAAHAFARPLLNAALSKRWPSSQRMLGALALLARSDLAASRPGSAHRVARLLWHRVTGR